MKKLVASMALIGLLSQSLAYGGSREKLGIPEPKLEQWRGAYILPYRNFYIDLYDVSGNGYVDFIEMFLISGRSKEGEKSRPLIIIHDKNNNGIPDPGELFISPKGNEDWKPYFGRNDAEI